MRYGAEFNLPGNPSIAVVGAGAIGTYYGAKLAHAGLNVSLLARSNHLYLREHGLEIHCDTGNFNLKHVCSFRRSEQIGHVDLVIIAIKTTANEDLKLLLPPLLGPNTIICTLQNGLGNEEFLAQIAGRERILCGVCHVCVFRASPGVTQKTAGGTIRLSDLSGGNTPRAASLASLFEGAGIQCSVAPSVGLVRWSKLVWNIPFNGLSITEGGIATSEILATPHLLQEASDLMFEVLEAAEAVGFPLDPDYPVKEIARTRWMGAYQPSSLLDFLAGKSIELESIWGIPLRMGTDAGIPMPHLATLYGKLKMISSS
jgi:2-dehydropantoate 2-reductase